MTGRISGMVVMLLLAAGAADSQTARTAPLMRDKLVHAQSLLEALTTSNFELLTRESAALTRIAESPRWAELKTRELKPQTDSFLKAVADLAAATKVRDLDAAALDYNALVTSCYQCHKRLKDMRIAR